MAGTKRINGKIKRCVGKVEPCGGCACVCFAYVCVEINGIQTINNTDSGSLYEGDGRTWNTVMELKRPAGAGVNANRCQSASAYFGYTGNGISGGNGGYLRIDMDMYADTTSPISSLRIMMQGFPANGLIFENKNIIWPGCVAGEILVTNKSPGIGNGSGDATPAVNQWLATGGTVRLRYGTDPVSGCDGVKPT